MAKKEDARQAWQNKIGGLQSKRAYRTALTGDGNGSGSQNFYFARDKTKIWVREQSGQKRPFLVTNRGKVGPYLNVPVFLGYTDTEPDIEQVVGVNWAAIPTLGASTIFSIGAHAQQHMFGGGDEVFVDSRLFIPGLVYPTNPPSMYVQVRPFIYHYNIWNKYNGGSSSDLSAYIPSGSGSNYLLIVLDPDSGNLLYRVNSSASGQQTWDQLIGGSSGGFSSFTNDVPKPLGSEIPLAIAYLASATSSIDWSEDNYNLIDARLHVQPSMHDLVTRVDQLEDVLGLDYSIPLTGAAQGATASFQADAWALQGIPISSTSPGNFDHLEYDGSAGFWKSASDLRVGPVNAAGTGTMPGWGHKLYLSGGPAAGQDSDNSDPIYLSRYNLSEDKSELRIAIGDNQDNVYADVFAVGSTSSNGGSFINTFRISSTGQNMMATYASQAPTACLITGACNGAINFYLDPATTSLKMKVKMPNGAVYNGTVSLVLG